MQKPPPDPVESLLGRMLREPEAQREPAVERALARLSAVRGDAAYLLMHRVLVLEAALASLQPATQHQSKADAATPPQARGFLRDAAVVTAGVLAGTWLAQGVASAGQDEWGVGEDALANWDGAGDGLDLL